MTAARSTYDARLFVAVLLPWLSWTALAAGAAALLAPVAAAAAALAAGAALLLVRSLALAGPADRALPLRWGGALHPATEEELVEALARLARSGRRPTLLGSGWSFFLNRADAPSPAVHTRLLAGRDASGMWRCGTTLRAVLTDMARRGKTLATCPSYDGITVGAWVASASHGAGTDASLTSVFGRARVLDLRTGETSTVSPQLLRQLLIAPLFELGPPPRTHALLALELVETEDALCSKTARVLATEADAAWWHASPSLLRLAFVGPGRTVGVLWTKVEGGGRDADGGRRPSPWKESVGRLRAWARLDLGSALGWVGDDASSLSTTERLSTGNAFVPPRLPWLSPLLLPLVLGRRRNTELFFDVRPSPSVLLRLLAHLEAEAAASADRYEVRMKRQGGCCLDVSSTDADARSLRLAEWVRTELGAGNVRFHPGKRVPPEWRE